MENTNTIYPTNNETTTTNTNVTNNKEVKTMNRTIKKVTLEKNSNGVYAWKYEKIDANGASMASVKNDYSEYIEYTLEWTTYRVGNEFVPKFVVATKEELNNVKILKAAASTTFGFFNNIVPEAIYGDDHKVKIGCFASQGGVKSGERYFCDPDFVEKYKAEGSTVDYSAEPAMEKYLEIRRKISLIEFDLAPMYFNSIKDNSLVESMNALKAEVKRLNSELARVSAAMKNSTIYPKFGVANANQVAAFFWTPCKKKGIPMKVRIMDEVKTKVACNGYVDTRNKKSWDVQDKMDGEDPYMEISIDDGSAFVDYRYAKKHGFFGGEVKDMTQARCGIGYKDGIMTEIALNFKGTIQVLDLPENMRDAIYVSESCAKGSKRFSKEEIESCEYQFYTMDRNIHTDGFIDIGPQVMMYILTQATPDEMKKLCGRQARELNELKTPEGYKKFVARMTKMSYWTTNWNRIGSAPYGKNLEGKLIGATVKMNHEGECSFKRETSIVDHAAFTDFAYSKMFVNSVAKEATAEYNKFCSATVNVEGASAKAQGDVVAILKCYQAQLEGKTVDIKDVAYIPADQVIVPAEWKKFGLKKGQRLFIYRNPYNSTTACVVTIFGFSKLRDTIQLSALDNNSHRLASDNDGDTIYASWNETIINIAERANEFAIKCGAKVLAYRTGEEDVKDRGIPADEYLAFAPANGAVGLVCEPLFGLVSRIPVGCQDPLESIYCGVYVHKEHGQDIVEEIYTCPAEIYRLLDYGFVGTTYTIDSAKKHYTNAYSDTEQSKRIKRIVNHGIYWTKVFYHPTEVKYDRFSDRCSLDEVTWYDRIGENGGLATMAKIAMNEVCPDLGVIVDFREILEGYEWTEYTEKHYSRGFVYNPTEYFKGVESDVYLMETKYEAVNDCLKEGGLPLDVDAMAEGGCIFDGEILGGDELKSKLVMNRPIRTNGMTGADYRKSVSLGTTHNTTLTIGRLRTRILRAINNVTAFDGYYEKKGDVREDVDGHTKKMIKMWTNLCCGEECSNEEATDILYDEVASYLFGCEASELFGADIQAFLSNHDFKTRLFIKEQEWLKKKIFVGEIDFKKLTPFEKDLVMGKIDINHKEEK